MRTSLALGFTIAQQFWLTLLPPLILTGVLATLQHSPLQVNSYEAKQQLLTRDQEASCHIDSSITDTCEYVRQHCADFANDGYINYFQNYYCATTAERPFLMIGMCFWLVIIFSAMAKVAGDYLAIHLEILVDVFGISQNLAGVTILAFGNGSSDLFSTLAAMNSNSGSLAINELFGAAAFITTVVLGLVMIAKPFVAGARALVGDVIWFMIAASVLTAFLADGKLVMAECLGIIGLYVAFVCFAIARPRSAEEISEVILMPETGVEWPGRATSNDPIESEETTRLLTAETPTTSAEMLNRIGNDIHDSGDGAVPHNHSELGENDSVAAPSTANGGERVEISIETSNLVSARRFLTRVIREMYPSFMPWVEESKAERSLTLLSSPILFFVGFTIQRPTKRHTDSTMSSQNQPPLLSDLVRKNWIFVMQTLIAPQFLAIVILKEAFDLSKRNVLIGVSISFAVGVAVTTYSLTAHLLHNPRHMTAQACMISLLSFSSALIWIYLISNTSVSLLQTLSSILSIPNAIFGAVIFAIGNSSNDLFANPVVARRGFPTLAASACFGGPLLNTFLGIGFGGVIQLLKQRSGNPSDRGYYSFQTSLTLFVSAANLLVGLATTLVYGFYNSWLLDRRLGFILIGIWTVFTIGNIGLSLSSIG